MMASAMGKTREPKRRSALSRNHMYWYSENWQLDNTDFW